MANDDKITVTFKISREDARKLNAYSYFIMKHLEKGNRVPARTFKKFLSFFDNADISEREFKDKLIISITEKIVSDLKKDYHFKYTRKVEKVKIFNTDDTPYPPDQFSLQHLVESAVQLIVYSKTKNDKEDCIRICYNHITQYRNSLNVSSKKVLTTYRSSVIAGKITMELGYGLTNKKPTNENIYQSTRNALTKIKKPKK